MEGESGVQYHKKNRHLQRLTSILDFPQDIILDLPRITMLGNKQLLVENHKGIIEYTPSLVRVKVNQGELLVKGEHLMIGSLQPEQILIEGFLAEVHYEI